MVPTRNIEHFTILRTIDVINPMIKSLLMEQNCRKFHDILSNRPENMYFYCLKKIDLKTVNPLYTPNC